jgi:cytochrome P450
MLHRFLLGNPLFAILIPSMETWNQVVQFTLKAVNSAIGEQGALKRDGELEAIALDCKGDMLSRWSAINLTNPEKMSTRDIIVHLSGNVFAGSDTTAIALRTILYYLTKEPEKMRKLVKEIDEMTAVNKLSDPVSYKEASTHLPYLNAVIKEAIRIHPSVGLLLERHVPPGGAFICGKHIPEGTIVGINAWVTQHDPEVFPNPEKFEPERWLDSSEEQLRQMEQSFFAFGAGTRTCIGKNISIMEMVKIIPQLLRKFEITLKYPDMEWKTKNIWFVQQEGVICNLKVRK